MIRRTVVTALVVIAALGMLASATPLLAQTADPSLRQVYEAADAGRLGEAQAMMDRVLRDHPDSAKAHYVEAELLARQERYPAAGGELETAEHLAPGLPFAKPESVAQLRQLISSSGSARSAPAAGFTGAPTRGGGVPWLFLIIGAGVIVLLVTLIRATRRLPAVGTQGQVGYLPGGPMPGVGPGMPGYPMGGMPMGGGGLGSGIIGGLATGAALGAGMVAGEQLMHHFTNPGGSGGYVPPLADSSASVPDNLGGQDFGVSDGGSWDDPGSSLSDGLAGGGGDDWT